MRRTQGAAQAFRRLIGGLAAEILHLEFSSFCVAQWCSARIAVHEAFRVLPDTHVLRGVFRALGTVPGFPTFAQFCAESRLYLFANQEVCQTLLCWQHRKKYHGTRARSLSQVQASHRRQARVRRIGAKVLGSCS